MGFIAGLLGGALAGAAGHRLLHKLRRGASVHIGWCAGGVGALWSVVGWQWATGSLPWWWLPIPTAVAWFGVLLAATDLRHNRLPNALTLPAYPVLMTATAIAASQAGGQVMAGATLGALVLYCLYAAVNLARPTALGGGDVKLSGTVGAALGAIGWPAVLVGTTPGRHPDTGPPSTGPTTNQGPLENRHPTRPRPTGGHLPADNLPRPNDPTLTHPTRIPRPPTA